MAAAKGHAKVSKTTAEYAAAKKTSGEMATTTATKKK